MTARISTERRHLGGGPTVRLAVLVAAGGAIGTAARAHLEATHPAPAGGWPWVTFWINMAGSLVLGLFLEALHRSGPDAGWRRGLRLGVGTGLVGGFTTYSTFVLEIDHLARDGHAITSVAYAVGSVVLGVLVAGAGVALAAGVHRAVRHRPGDVP